MTTENLTIADLELMSNKLSALISQYANDMSRVRFAHTSGYDDEVRYAARYKTQIKTFYNSTSTSDINAFLNNPDIIYVDLKIEKSGCVIVYKTIVYD